MSDDDDNSMKEQRSIGVERNAITHCHEARPQVADNWPENLSMPERRLNAPTRWDGGLISADEFAHFALTP